MVEGQKRRVESIKQQVQDIALNVRDRFKEEVSGKARTQRRRSRTCHDAPVGGWPGWSGRI
jgi:uncharacterized membrane protein